MKYAVKEIFLTLQGEGYNSGKTAIFCRFSGCNLWNGKEQDRKKSKCTFCDTDFTGVDGENGGKYTLNELVDKICKIWPKDKPNKFIVFTGGEPMLQLNTNLINTLKNNKFFIAVETNGTIKPPEGIDWICVSPKARTKTVLKKGNEIKVVFPQKGIKLKSIEKYNFEHFFLQPLDNKNLNENLKKTINFILKNPKWRLSLQSHKYLGIK